MGRLISECVGQVAETILKAGYGALIDLEWFLINKGIIDKTPPQGIYDDLDYADDTIH